MRIQITKDVPDLMAYWIFSDAVYDVVREHTDTGGRWYFIALSALYQNAPRGQKEIAIRADECKEISEFDITTKDVLHYYCPYKILFWCRDRQGGWIGELSGITCDNICGTIVGAPEPDLETSCSKTEGTCSRKQLS